MNLSKYGIGVSLKRDYDAIILGALLGAIVIPHVPVVNEVFEKVNSFITEKVGL